MKLDYDETQGAYRFGALCVAPQLTDELLATAYLRLKRDKLLETIHHERVPSLTEFLKMHSSPGSIALGAFIDRAEAPNVRMKAGYDFCGLSWVFDREDIAGVNMSKASVGFAFFRHAAHPQEKIALGKMMIECFFERWNIDILFGLTPAPNRAALNYAEQVGFRISARIADFCSWEGALTEGVYSSLAKTDWLAAQS